MLARNYKNILKDLQADVVAINAALAANLQTHVPFISEVGRHILLSGGKRVRPLLFLLSARLCGCQSNHLTDYSTIFEYLHAATLLHDDVVDAATVRRGISTANTIYGNQAVILVGDFLLSKSLSLAVDTDKLKVLKVLAHTTTLMAEGEILQLLHARNLDLTEAQYFEVTLRKTAALMSAACQIGAILAGVPEVQEEALTQFGLNLGITFQVVDDILDFTGDEQELGKPVINDLKEGRITLPIIHALAHAGEADRRRLKDLAQEVRPETAPEILALLDQTGSLTYAREQARHYTLKAQENLQLFPESMEKSYFWAITEELLRRTH
jgi:octaprenyl-diphosphate synthase